MNRRLKRTRGLLCSALAIAVTCIATVSAQAAATHVILCGSGGETEYQERFYDWGTRLHAVLIDKMGVDPERVHLLVEQRAATGETEIIAPIYPAAKPIGEASIRSLFETLRHTSTEDDDLFVYLIGHGSHIRDDSKFHIPGKDITAKDLGAMLDEIPSRATVVLNSTSSSAGFINFLSGPNRIICTATKSVREENATRFMQYFIEGIEEGSADRNHDERISFLEACEQAAELTATSYVVDSLIATEHALIDDNGDMLGSRLPIGEADDPDDRTARSPQPEGMLDGAVAARCFIKNFQFAPDVPRSLIDTYTKALDDINALKERKETTVAQTYYSELEALLLHAAQTNRSIKMFDGPDKGET